MGITPPLVVLALGFARLITAAKPVLLSTVAT